MTTIEAKIPEPVLRQAEQLAEREQISLEQLISLAVTQSIGIWSNQSYVARRATRGNREDFLNALDQVPDVEPPEYDHLPEGYEPKPA
jgi:hypothetical protein